MPIWRREPDEEPRIDSILILLDTLTPPERRDLADALLRAAWCGHARADARPPLLDAAVAMEHEIFGDAQ